MDRETHRAERKGGVWRVGGGAGGVFPEPCYTGLWSGEAYAAVAVAHSLGASLLLRRLV